MRPSRFNFADEPFEQWRQRMLSDTGRFIEWGLAHPDKVEWIPRHQVGHGVFTERVKNLFWMLVANNEDMPEQEVPRWLHRLTQ